MHTSCPLKCFTILPRNFQLTLVRSLRTLSPLCQKNYYSVLDLPQNCSDKDVRNAYIRLSKEFHPDKNPNSKDGEKRMVEINEAYTILGRKSTRRKYDAYIMENPWMHDNPKEDFTSSYDELKYRYNKHRQYVYNKKYAEEWAKEKRVLPFHRVLFMVVCGMILIGLVEFSIVRKLVKGPDEIIEGIPVYHSELTGRDMSHMSSEQIDEYNASKRRIIVNAVRVMKAENDARLREHERLRTIMDNNAKREKDSTVAED